MKRACGRVRVQSFDLGRMVGVAVDTSRGTDFTAMVRVAKVAAPYQGQQKREAARMAIKAIREGFRHASQ